MIKLTITANKEFEGLEPASLNFTKTALHKAVCAQVAIFNTFMREHPHFTGSHNLGDILNYLEDPETPYQIQLYPSDSLIGQLQDMAAMAKRSKAIPSPAPSATCD